MSADSPAQLEAFPSADGHVVRLLGRGTMRESRVFHDFARQCLTTDDVSVLTLDLSQCQRLDSTFMGCLVDLHKRFNQDARHRFIVSAPPDVARELLGVCRLDRLLPVRDQTPRVTGDGLLLPILPLEPRMLGEHVMDCHRRLVEQNCPGQKAFARVANDLEKELSRLP
jgi:anti-anti-sigma regulatory factor